MKKNDVSKKFFFTQKCLPIFEKCHKFSCFETAKYKFRTRFKIRIGRTIFFNSKWRKVSPAGTWFCFLILKIALVINILQFQLLGSFTETVSSFGQFHSETVLQLSKVSQKLSRKKGTFLAKTKVKENEKTAFNFLFYYATVSVENWQIKIALFVSFFL